MFFNSRHRVHSRDGGPSELGAPSFLDISTSVSARVGTDVPVSVTVLSDAASSSSRNWLAQDRRLPG